MIDWTCSKEDGQGNNTEFSSENLFEEITQKTEVTGGRKLLYVRETERDGGKWMQLAQDRVE